MEVSMPLDHINLLEGIDGAEIKNEFKKRNNTSGYKRKKEK
jgi:hypothetical protein